MSGTGADPAEWTAQHGPYKWTEIDPMEVQRRLGGEEPPQVVDVREPWEHRQGVIPGAVLLPLGQLPARFEELDRDRETVVVCAHGVRSADATLFLTARGFRQAKSMAGGMSRWSGSLQGGQVHLVIPSTTMPRPVPRRGR